jgi:hypothetical protein
MIKAPRDKFKATQVIASSKVEFEHPHPDVHVAKILIANASWVNTSEGTVGGYAFDTSGRSDNEGET